MKKQRIKCLILMVSGLLMACSSSTRITGSWMDPEAAGKTSMGKSIFIASLTRNIEVRTKLENALAVQAEQYHIKAIKSGDYFDPDFYQKRPSKDQLLSQISNTGADAILTVTLINKESDTRYVHGDRMYRPVPSFGWYGGFYSYYNYWQPFVYEPGYYVTDKTYFLETNLYDVKTEKLIWSAQSETVNPGSIDNFVRTYPKVLTDQMVKDGLLATINTSP